MTDTKATYNVSKAQQFLRCFDNLCKRFRNWFAALSIECRCYAIGLVILVFAAILVLFKQSEAGFLAQAGAFVFAVGLLPLIEWLYEWAWHRLLGKLLIVTLIALATNIAYGVGRQMVAGLVGASPEQFGATVNVATILLSPVLFLVSLAFGGIFIFILALQFGMFALVAVLPHVPASRSRRTGLWICRIIALAIAVFGSMTLLKRSNGYSGWVERRTASYLYTFDMYHDTHYATGKSEKVALLGDGRILVASPKKEGGYDLIIRRVPDGNAASQ